MTQTNKERDALIADAKDAGFTIKDMPTGLIVGTPDNHPLGELLSKFAAIRDARAQSPTSQNEQQEPIAYLKFYAKQWFINPEIGMDCCEGLEVCRKDEIGDDGLPAFAVFTSPPKQAIPEDVIKDAERYRKLKELSLTPQNFKSFAISKFNGRHWDGYEGGLFEIDKELDKFIFLAPTNTEAGE